MDPKKLKILVLYSCSEYPFRKTFQAFMDSFQKYSQHQIYYVNFPFYFCKKSLGLVDWDLIIYTHSFTAPWNRSRYLNKIKILEELNLKSRKSIAFFQDEYFNLDLTNLFIQRLNVDQVYSVAPESEWSKLYPEIPSTKIKQFLTGYIEPADIQEAQSILKSTQKNLDISYRTAYPGPAMASLGDVGWLKYEIAEFGKRLKLTHSDIQVGTGFLNGDGWFRLLARSKFILGTPSGANIIDTKGSVSQLFANQHTFDRKALTAILEKNKISQNLYLEVISPRIFEAGIFNCCQILVEADYNGILKKNVHYLPVSRNLDNLSEVLNLIGDDNYVSNLLKNFREDIIENPAYHYQTFVNGVFEYIKDLKPTPPQTSILIVRMMQVFMNIGLRIYASKIIQSLLRSR